MSRLYTVSFENVAVTAIQDFLEIQPADDKPCRLKAMIIDQFSDLGDAQEEGLRITIKRIVATATSGSGGTAPTPRLVTPTGAAAGFTAEVNNTTPATSSGTIELLAALSENIRLGRELWLPPELQFECVQAAFLVVRLEAAPADSLSMSGTFWIEEEG